MLVTASCQQRKQLIVFVRRRSIRRYLTIIENEIYPRPNHRYRSCILGFFMPHDLCVNGRRYGEFISCLPHSGENCRHRHPRKLGPGDPAPVGTTGDEPQTSPSWRDDPRLNQKMHDANSHLVFNLFPTQGLLAGAALTAFSENCLRGIAPPTL